MLIHFQHPHMLTRNTPKTPCIGGRKNVKKRERLSIKYTNLNFRMLIPNSLFISDYNCYAYLHIYIKSKSKKNKLTLFHLFFPHFHLWQVAAYLLLWV